MWKKLDTLSVSILKAIENFPIARIEKKRAFLLKYIQHFKAFQLVWAVSIMVNMALP